MGIEPESCVFNSNGYCVLTDKQCVRACIYAMKRYPDLRLRDHLECHWRKRERTVDLLTRWIAVGTAVAALTVSILAYLARHGAGS